MKSESGLEKYGVKVIDKLKPVFQCLICEYTWIPEKRSDGKMPCEYWYCPNNCTDWRWQSSGDKWILKDSLPFVFEVPFEIKSSVICKEYMIKKIRKEIGKEIYKDIVKKFKELKKFLFSWPESSSDITETDKTRIKETVKEILSDDMDVNWIEDSDIDNNRKRMTLTDKKDNENKLCFEYEKEWKVSLKIKKRGYKNYRKVLKLAMEIENDLQNIYKLPKFDLALHLEIGTYRLNYQDVDNIQKTVLDGLKKYLFEDDAQIFRVLCWKTKKQENDKYNMAAITISFRIYAPDKQMCLVKLDKSFGGSGLAGCKDDF